MSATETQAVPAGTQALDRSTRPSVLPQEKPSRLPRRTLSVGVPIDLPPWRSHQPGPTEPARCTDSSASVNAA
jgi:hypothetical protein